MTIFCSKWKIAMTQVGVSGCNGASMYKSMSKCGEA